MTGNNHSIPPTLDGWVYIYPIHGPLDGPLYPWAQYTPTVASIDKERKLHTKHYLLPKRVIKGN